MDILMIAHFTQAPIENGNNRFNYLAARLTKIDGNDVELVTTTFSHTRKEQRDFEYMQGSNDNYKATMLYEPGYAKNVSMKRFYSHWVMGRKLKEYLKKRKNPDVIYCAIPSLDVARVAAEYAKKNKIRFIIDVQDLWPEAFKMILNIPIISNIIFLPMQMSANYVYRQADAIVAVSDTYCQRALSVNEKCNSTHTVFLGTDLSVFDDNVKKNKVELDDTYFYIAYCGTLGHSYDIRCVIDAMEYLKINKQIDKIKFIVMGDGPLKAVFEQYAVDKGVNVEFTGRLSYDKMCALLAACDVAVNPILHGAAQSIINKHADYAAAGIPVISTQECEEYQHLVEQYEMGINCLSGDFKRLADAILRIYSNEKLRITLGDNARKCAEDKFDRKNAYVSIIDMIR